jgi:hypothetical protein
MNDEQKGWLRALSFLKLVDREGIKKVLPSADADQVLAWFKSEASIRDPDAARWCVLPIIRSRVQEYVRIDSTKEHGELQHAVTSL